LDDKRMNVLKFRSPKTEVRESPIHGKGLFARQAMAAGEIVAVKGGHILTGSEWGILEKELGSAEIQIADDLFIGPVARSEREGSMLYTNHSCEPNIAIHGQNVFVAMRDIGPGEELTHDWATTDDMEYEMECRCGRQNCRRLVTGRDWRRKSCR
jgi:uncharacterized protein